MATLTKQETVNKIADLLVDAKRKFDTSRRLIAEANDRSTALEDGNYLAMLADGSHAIVQCDGEGHAEVLELRKAEGAL